MSDISLVEARRIALHAQGFSSPRNNGTAPGRDDMRRVIESIGLVQIDSVNVLARAHYMPFYSRLGPYRETMLDELAYERRELFEYWGHEASFIPMNLYPVMRHRMDSEPRRWIEKARREFPEIIEDVFRQVNDRGPLSVSELEGDDGRTGPWWGLSKGKRALEFHFALGAVGVHSRRNFSRYYDLPDRFIPGEHFSAPAMTEADAHRHLLRISAKCHGVGTANDLADYFRIKPAKARGVLRDMVTSGELQQVSVEGWGEPAYMLPGTDAPAEPVGARSLVSPFDSLIWYRERMERLFGMRYRIEIYVPEKKRQYGYYVLPFLMGEQLVARLDLKADRHTGKILVQAAHLEPGQDTLA
ncbi:MAG: winged helix DNA-binding domain-containing protein, partial [Chloroflexi bacterium]|nr:winged helix DNA-binding domain-containing protein [Chloroflexota bacterium]